MRVCLISPGHLSTNPRLVKEASALTDKGHTVSIVCGRYIDSAFEWDRVLIDPRWRVTYVPYGPIEAPKLTYVLQTLMRHAAKALVHAGMARAEVVEAAHAAVSPDLVLAAAAVPADIYIARYVAALPAAARAARKRGVPYAFDAEDFHFGDLPDQPEHALNRRLIRAIESSYLPGAAYITAASPMIADAYVETYGIPRPTVVLNSFPAANAPSFSTPRGTAKPGPSLYWFSQTIGAGRGLETAIEAIARASSEPHLYLRGTPAAGYKNVLATLAQQCGVVDRVHLLDPEAPGEMERLGAQYDLGFSGETGFSRNNGLALGNKIFSYLIGGVPIVASDTPAHRTLAPDLGEAMTLFPIDDAVGLAGAIDLYLRNPERLAEARSLAWRLGQEKFNWEVERGAFLDAVDGALARRKIKA